jgi:hypothetical protein
MKYIYQEIINNFFLKYTNDFIYEINFKLNSSKALYNRVYNITRFQVQTEFEFCVLYTSLQFSFH